MASIAEGAAEFGIGVKVLCVSGLLPGAGKWCFVIFSVLEKQLPMVTEIPAPFAE